MSFRLVLTFIFFATTGGTVSKATSLDSLWKIFYANGDDQLLQDVATKYEQIGAATAWDSILDAAITEAVLKNEKVKVINFSSLYFSKKKIDLKKAIVYARQMHNVAKNSNNNIWLYRTFKAQARIDLEQNNPEKALENANRAYYHISHTEDDRSKIECLLLQGRCLEDNNRKIEAFRNYMDALHLAEIVNDEVLKYQCYSYFSSFFYLINNIEKAKEYKLKQLASLTDAEVHDSIRIMSLSNELAAFFLLNGEQEHGEKLLHLVIAYCSRVKNQEVKNDAFAILRTNLIDQKKFSELATLYIKQYPSEYSYIKSSQPEQYFRLMAFIMEAQGNSDSALAYYRFAEEKLLASQQDANFLSNFYKRYGEFYFRRGDLVKAQEHFLKSFEYAKQGQYLPFLIETTKLLDTVNILSGNVGRAYMFSKLNQGYAAALAASVREEEVLRLEIDAEAKNKELELQREQEQTRRRHNLQYMGLTVGLTTSLIILAMLGAFKVHRWAIKAMGFFTFIFFFEFIILMADNQIHHATHGEPWKIMGIKILLISVLYPLHHYVEEKVVHYLTHHKLIDTTKLSLKWWAKKPEKEQQKEIKESAKEEVLTEN